MELLALLRDMPWLTRRRATLYGAALTVLETALFVRSLAILNENGGYVGDHFFGEDFLSFWAASRQILLGHPAEVYVPALHKAAEMPYLRVGYEAFFYPPPYMLVCLPLGLAPLFVGYGLFMAATLGAFAATLSRIFRSGWSVFAFLSFPAVFLTLIAGQNALLVAAILGFGLMALDKRPWLAGAALGLLVIKPHLALGAPIALLATGRWRVLLAAAASAACLIAMSYLAFGFETWAGFFANSGEVRATLESGGVGFAKMQSAFALARALGAGVAVAYALHAALALIAAGALVHVARRRKGSAVERSAIVVAGFLLSPFSLHYDTLLFALPLAWMIEHWRKRSFPAWSKLGLCVVFFAPFLSVVPVAPPPFVNALPFGVPTLILFGWLLLREALARPLVQAADTRPTNAV